MLILLLKINNKKNRLHERCLHLIYDDKCSSFEELLVKVKPVSIHHKNINALGIDMLKVYTKTSPEIMQEVFQIKDQGHYFLRKQRDFVIKTVKSVNYGLESIRFVGQKIWKSLDFQLRNGNQDHIFVVSVKHTYRT